MNFYLKISLRSINNRKVSKLFKFIKLKKYFKLVFTFFEHLKKGVFKNYRLDLALFLLEYDDTKIISISNNSLSYNEKRIVNYIHILLWNCIIIGLIMKCWTAAKPGRSERGQAWPVRTRPSLAGPNAAKIRRPIWGSDRRPKIWTAKEFFPLIWSDCKFRHPYLITCLYLILNLAAGLTAKVAVRLYNRPSRRSCSRFKKFLAASMPVCTVLNTRKNVLELTEQLEN
ncbi:hypothetical protein BpHYR1_036015 [Brachionus plicatilis]|uniref:Uncharacterized protein n=1 Tax=Brachionus plicatilis TaxID=10195 RepID=A0A3M7SY17_BRAPC|nr:hypothetical protein BpHYR1_036015 [Brachionus plicatilis]